MGKIIQLSENLSNLIAAGEVVENMASVVKELVENSIDANSTSIKIDLLEAGLNEIKVTDNGSGMSLEDMKMSFQRHATSKIKTSHDLYHIGTLGFRGEAIPSIASVSHFEMISSEGETGNRLFFLKGELKESGSFAPRKGTTIAVRYLFYNTPARLKHLKATNTELSYIMDYVNKIALSHPEIAFVLTNNQRVLFQTTGSNDYLRVLSNIYSLDIIKNMISFEAKNQYFAVSGYATKPMFNRSSRNSITLIVNGRVIKNNKVINAVIDGYKNYLPIGKYPIVFLKIDLDPLLIDVNIHPQKLEVKFTEERNLCSLITKTINEKLQTLSLIPQIKEELKVETTYKYDTLKLKDEAEEKQSLVKEDFVNYINHLVEKKKHSDSIQNSESKKPVLEEKKLPELEYIGQLLGTYLLFQNETGLFMIDQHAAAERIRYERYFAKMSDVKIESYDLLLPITLNLSNKEVLQLQDSFDVFQKMGISFEINEVKTIDIVSVPTWFVEGYEAIYTEEIIKYVLEGQDVSVGEIIDSLAKSLSCKHSIKANKFINQNEITRLMKDLDQCVNPYTCPHGRPTIIQLSQSDIEKMFKRIMS
ncbi:MAG: DNA mismatch repair endonuclease MutL [Bacilli bacterium]|nr:DNA mismatch repair endonuclease MutL [Bacilli bacterium]